jgi:hypothetical protein
MTTKEKIRSAAVPLDGGLPIHSWSTPPSTTEDRLERIRALGIRIDGYIQHMCAVDSLGGTSLEAKEKAVVVFYECLQSFEQRLARIQDNLRLE